MGSSKRKNMALIAVAAAFLVAVAFAGAAAVYAQKTVFDHVLWVEQDTLSDGLLKAVSVYTDDNTVYRNIIAPEDPQRAPDAVEVWNALARGEQVEADLVLTEEDVAGIRESFSKASPTAKVPEGADTSQGIYVVHGPEIFWISVHVDDSKGILEKTENRIADEDVVDGLKLIGQERMSKLRSDAVGE